MTELAKPEFKKNCVHCKKSFTSSARNTRFCTEVCCDRYAKRKKKSKVFRDENKDLLRFKARVHALAVDLLRFRFHQLGKEPCCNNPDCGKPETEVSLETDHINTNWLDNRPENLQFLCIPCHKVKSVNETVDKTSEFYDMFKDIYK